MVFNFLCFVSTLCSLKSIQDFISFILFVMQAISLREVEDIASLEEKLGRPLSKQERSRIGVSSLRLFLEELLQRRWVVFILLKWKCSQFSFLFVTSITKYFYIISRYMDSVPLIIPLLEKEYRSTTRKLNEINQELRFVL